MFKSCAIRYGFNGCALLCRSGSNISAYKQRMATGIEMKEFTGCHGMPLRKEGNMSKKQEKIARQRSDIDTVNAKISQTMKLQGVCQEEIDSLKDELARKNEILRWFGWIIFTGGFGVLGLDIVQGWLLSSQNFSFTYNQGVGRQQILLAGLCWCISLILVSVGKGKGKGQ